MRGELMMHLLLSICAWWTSAVSCRLLKITSMYSALNEYMVYKMLLITCAFIDIVNKYFLSIPESTQELVMWTWTCEACIYAATISLGVTGWMVNSEALDAGIYSNKFLSCFKNQTKSVSSSFFSFLPPLLLLQEIWNRRREKNECYINGCFLE